jgi:hypothetical protein
VFRELCSYVYEDLMPCSKPGFRESYIREQATLKRAEEMKFKALMKGHILHFNAAKASAKDLKQAFTQPERPERTGIPVYKLSELKQMNEAFKV